MEVLFFLLSLASTICLVVGLVSPSFLKFKSRLGVFIFFGAGIIIFLTLLGINAPSTSPANNNVPQPTVVVPQAPTRTASIPHTPTSTPTKIKTPSNNSPVQSPANVVAQVPTQQATSSTPPPAATSSSPAEPAITIDSIECIVAQPLNSGGWQYVDINEVGTASGPVDTTLSVDGIATTNFNCGSWTGPNGGVDGYSGSCKETSGQPDTTHWTASIELDFQGAAAHQENMGMTETNPDMGYTGYRNDVQKTVVCP
jgi:hypothetical protein